MSHQIALWISSHYGIKKVTSKSERFTFKEIQQYISSTDDKKGGEISTLPSCWVKKKFEKYIFYVHGKGHNINLRLNYHMFAYLREMEMVVGDVFITKNDEDGETISLTKEDIYLFMNYLR